jgi:hypothetical protein
LAGDWQVIWVWISIRFLLIFSGICGSVCGDLSMANTLRLINVVRQMRRKDKLKLA